MQWLCLRVSNQGDPRLSPMGSQFSISVLLNLCSELKNVSKNLKYFENIVFLKLIFHNFSYKYMHLYQYRMLAGVFA